MAVDNPALPYPHHPPPASPVPHILPSLAMAALSKISHRLGTLSLASIWTVPVPVWALSHLQASKLAG